MPCYPFDLEDIREIQEELRNKHPNAYVLQRNLWVQQLSERDDAKVVRAELIRFLARGGNQDWPVGPSGFELWGARIEGEVNLDGLLDVVPMTFVGCTFQGALRLQLASGRLLNLTGCRVPSLWAPGLIMEGDVQLDNGFISDGVVTLTAAKIGGNLDLKGANLLGTNREFGESLECARAHIGGGVYLSRGFLAIGGVIFRGAEVCQSFSCAGGTFRGKAIAMDLSWARVAKSLDWQNLSERPEGIVDMTNTSVKNLEDDLNSWPPGKSRLRGLEYRRYGSKMATYFERKKWLEQQFSPQNYSPQPWNQAAMVLADMGLNNDAKRLDIFRRRLERRAAFPSALRRSRAIWERRSEIGVASSICKVFLEFFRAASSYSISAIFDITAGFG